MQGLQPARPMLKLDNKFSSKDTLSNNNQELKLIYYLLLFAQKIIKTSRERLVETEAVERALLSPQAALLIECAIICTHGDQ